jgi:hypothetical protein
VAAVTLSLWALAGTFGASASESDTPLQQGGTIGLVVGSLRFALFESPEAKQECPQGFTHKLMDNYSAEYPTDEAKSARERQFGYYTNRGPNGENVFHFPTAVQDPLPFRAAAGATAFGLDLDGRTDPDDFTSPEGAAGIDNQMYRVLGCTPGWRSIGMIAGLANQTLRGHTYGRILIEIAAVDAERDDGEVAVTIYRGLDPVPEDASGKLIPWRSQRIDYKRGLRYVRRLHGRLAAGVLTTDPVDVTLPFYEIPGIPGDRLLHQMRLKLQISADGASGFIAGYEDIEQWWLMNAKTWGAFVIADIQGWSGPSTYAALYRFADYPDPSNGRPLGISTAYKVEFAKTYIVHSETGDMAAQRVFEEATAR